MISSVVKIALSYASNIDVVEVWKFSQEFVFLPRTEQMYILPPPL